MPGCGASSDRAALRLLNNYGSAMVEEVTKH
jgi:hypothetical protein